MAHQVMFEACRQHGMGLNAVPADHLSRRCRRCTCCQRRRRDRRRLLHRLRLLRVVTHGCRPLIGWLTSRGQWHEGRNMVWKPRTIIDFSIDYTLEQVAWVYISKTVVTSDDMEPSCHGSTEIEGSGHPWQTTQWCMEAVSPCKV